MRVGIFYGSGGTPEQLSQLVEQIGLADRLGIDSVWIADRRGQPDTLGSPAIVLAALAKRTAAIRLGTFKQLGAEHPVRTAEDFALVDLLSGGRLNFGAALEADGAEADVREHLQEALDLIAAAWAFDEFSYGGTHYRFPAHTAPGTGLRRKRFGAEPYRPQWERGPELPDFLTVTPKPLQQPRPPIWILASARWLVPLAAERGYSLVLPPAPLPSLQAAADAYEEGLRRAGRARSEVELAVIADLPLGPEGLAPDALERAHGLHGATGANHIVWRIPFPGAPHAAIAASLRRLASEVQPHLQA